jgi:hypothetical protein
MFYSYDSLVIQASDEKATVLGTVLANKLRSNGFKGIVVLRSADDAEDHQHDFMKDGAVDICVGKTQSMKELAETIRKKVIDSK